MMGFWDEWHQLDHMQTICTSPEKDNHTNTQSLNFYRPDLFLPTNSVKALNYTHMFNGPLSGTTQVSRYQKGKTTLDFTEANDSK